ncbi:MAG: aminotransferase class IV [Proteobacteria bacterium]|nr:aminotransferase class IV [Pseudomonadota bacterium]
MTVFLNGRLVADDEARIDPTDRGLTLGDGLFETIAVRDRQAARTDAHLARLRDGAEVIGLAVPYAGHELKRALREVIEANAIDFGVLRLTLTRGLGPRGLPPPVPAQPTLLITGVSQDLTAQEPVTAVIATTTRRNEHSPLSGIKSTSALDSILAAREAAKRGAGDALLLNGAGKLAEATAANLFLVIDGGLVTPSIHDGAMPGVMRADVIRGLSAVARTLGPADLSSASEAFLTNSLGIRPLTAVDGEPIGDGNPGPVSAEARKIV